ncbi:MAG: NUDIX domain-containing protein [Streptosporangiaceae bacterium]
MDALFVDDAGQPSLTSDVSHAGRSAGLAACHSQVMEDHHVVAVILLRAGQVLLCHRSPGRRWYPDMWDFPGGHVLPGERPEDALRREVAEELGAELDGVEGVPVLHRIDPQAGLDLTVWVSRRWRGSIANLQPHEHDAIGWFDKEQLGELSFADSSYLSLLQDLLSA